MATTDPHRIIAIGVSAGSSVVELLSRRSKLKLLEAENDIQAKCNMVCLIPNDRSITIPQWAVVLTTKNMSGPSIIFFGENKVSQ
jgi:chemotaxis response regulator CheB